MPNIPQIKTMNASVYDILNAIRANSSAAYADRVPVATQENIREVGNAIMMYQATQNEFLSALVNRIARVIITSKSYSNPLAKFKKGTLEYGETIEEVFVNIAKAHQFNPTQAESDVFKREIPDVAAVFHRLNVQNFYKTTVSNEQLRQAFLSAQGVSDLIARIVDSLYTGAEFDEFVMMKQLIVDAANDGKMKPVHIDAVTAANAKKIVSTIKGVSNKLEFMSNEYNAIGVLTHTPKSKQILIMDAAFDATIDVEVLASAFNMDKAEFMGQRVLIDNFGTLTGVVAALVDEDWFMVFDNFLGFTENYNGEGLYWNYFYHVWKTFSTSPFSNAILFTTDKIAVTSVTVNPKTATIARGASADFTATVATTGYAPKDVTWQLRSSTGEHPVSTVDQNGHVTIAANETATTITLSAISTFDKTKLGAATITVS